MSNFMQTGKLSLGIDIGTTTISLILLHPITGETPYIRTIPNDTAIPTANPIEHLQNPIPITAKITSILTDLCIQYPAISNIGITGQMHGILYTDKNGTAVSPLYTWQDGHATPAMCSEILAKTGYHTSPGYGLATHYALTKNGSVPEDAAALCTIMDYVAMCLTGNTRPVTHATNAASLGLYRRGGRRTDGQFDHAALSKLGLSAGLLPDVVTERATVGEYTTSDGRKIPVTVAIGDNQAAFLGSVRDVDAAILVNIGTGSQVSLAVPDTGENRCGSVETRPFLPGKLLYSGSGLCGGRAYAMLERFFRSYAVSLGLPDTERYAVLNQLAAKGLASGHILNIQTTFCGTREDPAQTGQIVGITEETFTPEALAAGILTGMAKELYDMLQTIPHDSRSQLVVSGNGVRKNPVLRQILSDMFGLPSMIPVHTEEAAFGAALFAAGETVDLSRCIWYEE